jgi:hypothetical protein
MKQVALCLLILAAAPAWAQKIDRLQALGQQEFRQVSEDLGGALSYRPLTPTEPLGIIGWDFGVAVTGVKLHSPESLRRATSDSVPSTLPVPTLRLNKGLPAGFDIGVLYSQIPGSDIKFYGGELRYAILKGGITAPAVGVRGSFTKLSGVDQLDLNTRGLDLSISKGFAFFTPYAGVGKVWVKSDPHVGSFLHSEDFSLNKLFIGAGMKWLALNINLEADRTGPVNGYSIKVGLRF